MSFLRQPLCHFLHWRAMSWLIFWVRQRLTGKRFRPPADSLHRQTFPKAPGTQLGEGASAAVGPQKAIYSIKYSLAEHCTSYATDVAVKLKTHSRLGKYEIYFPSAFNKESCDPQYTCMSWPCRGTRETCKMELALRTGQPTNSSCWRYSFRKHQEKCKLSGGFMIQVWEGFGQGSELGFVFGAGQEIERAMANEIKLKVFLIRQGLVFNDFFARTREFDEHDAEYVARAIEAWYEAGAKDLSLKLVALRSLGWRGW